MLSWPCSFFKNSLGQLRCFQATRTKPGHPRSRWPDRIELWSDHLRAHTCSRCARITWSGKGFKRTFIWTMVWNLIDQRPLCSGTVWSEATLVWDGLIRGHFGLGRSDQRQFQAHTSLIRGRFERTLVWPETKSSDFFSSFFLFFYWHLLCLVRVNNKTAFWSDLRLKIWGVWSEPRGPADSDCRSPQEENLNHWAIEIHVQPLTIKFITAAAWRVWVWIWEIGSKLYTVTGVRSHFKQRGGFLLAFPDCDYLSLITSG